MKDLSERISAVCHTQHQRGNGVLPPQVCPYCFQCPIATLVVGVTGAHYQREPLSIPDDAIKEVEIWLSKFN